MVDETRYRDGYCVLCNDGIIKPVQNCKICIELEKNLDGEIMYVMPLVPGMYDRMVQYGEKWDTGQLCRYHIQEHLQHDHKGFKRTIADEPMCIFCKADVIWRQLTGKW